FSLRDNGNAPHVSAVELVRQQRTLAGLRRTVNDCRSCELWRDATQAVLGEGPVHAHVMLDEGGVDRDQVYVTNAVKHLKWRARGKGRIHDRPTAAEFAAYRPWLDAELRFVAPHVLVPLGAGRVRRRDRGWGAARAGSPGPLTSEKRGDHGEERQGRD